MKKDLDKWSVLRPLLIGLIAVGVGVGLVFWFRSADNSSAASFVVAGLTIAAGAAMAASSIWFGYRLRFQNAALLRGVPIEAQYVSHDCKMSTSKSALYNVTFRYALSQDGEQTDYRSPNCFQWDEVLAIRCAGKVNAKAYRGKLVLTDSLEVLKINYANEMARLEKVYEEAYRKVDDINRKDDPALSKRRKNAYEKKQAKRKIAEEDKPSAKDD